MSSGDSGVPGALTKDTIYKELCASYRAIDDFRSKLLGFLPLATGAGVLFGVKETPSLLISHAETIAVFGFTITLGLLCLEIYGVTKCAALIVTGAKFELAHGAEGQFAKRPQALLWCINEPFAAAVIYPAVLAAWTAIGNLHSGDSELSQHAKFVAGLVFAAGFTGIVVYDRYLDWTCRKNLKNWLAYPSQKTER